MSKFLVEVSIWLQPEIYFEPSNWSPRCVLGTERALDVRSGSRKVAKNESLIYPEMPGGVFLTKTAGETKGRCPFA